MNNLPYDSRQTIPLTRSPYRRHDTKRHGRSLAFAMFLLVDLALLAGCRSTSRTGQPVVVDRPVTQTSAVPEAAIHHQTRNHPEVLTLLEGDVLKISFPGAPNLDTTQQIRRDGVIALSLVGEVEAAGLTPKELEERLEELYAPQLVSKEVNVTVVSSAFTVFVIGAVVNPEKIQSNRPLTALEAIMEAGGFDQAKANLKTVTVIRHEHGEVQHYTLNLKLVLDGKQSKPFYLKSSDIIYVRERIVWF